jgi:hypothetical protein
VEGTSPGRAVLNAVVCTRVHELQDPLSAATVPLEISSRNASRGSRSAGTGCVPAST